MFGSQIVAFGVGAICDGINLCMGSALNGRSGLSVSLGCFTALAALALIWRVLERSRRAAPALGAPESCAA